MASLRPHKNINFVGLWKYGFIISGVLIALAIIGLIASFVVTGSALTLGTEFSGGTSIQLTNTGDITESQVRDAFSSADSSTGISTEISSLQTSTDAQGNAGFIVRTTDTNSSNANTVMTAVKQTLSLNDDDVKIETIGASWGASVIWSSILAFILSCIAILLVITFRYRDPRMGAVALITLFHDLLIVIGVYAWAGIFIHLEVTSDVIAALLAIIGYSLYDTIVTFHRINMNASPQMKMSMKTCANLSINQIFMRSINTSITSMLPILLILILGTDTLRDFAFAMFAGMLCGIYSTFAISGPIYTLWKTREEAYARLEKKFPYECIQPEFTKDMLKQARIDRKERIANERAEAAAAKAEEAKAAAEAKAEAAKKAAETAESDEVKEPAVVSEPPAETEEVVADAAEEIAADPAEGESSKTAEATSEE